MKKIIAFICVFLLTFCFFGCDEGLKINFSKDSLDLKVGDSYEFSINQEVNFEVEDPTILKLENNVITCLKEGTTKVTISLKINESIKKDVTVNVGVATVYTITYDLDGGSCDNLVESFTDPTKVSLPTPTKENYVFLGWFENNLEVTSLSKKNYNLKARWEENSLEVESIDIEVLTPEVEGVPEFIYADTVCYLKAICNPTGANQEVVWRSLNRTRATIDEDGKITILSGESASFRATSVQNESIMAEITVEFKSYKDPVKFLDSIQISEITAKDIRSHVSVAGIPYYLLGSVSYYLFQPLNINYNYLIPTTNANRPGKTNSNGVAFYPVYVTVHDVGATGSAAANASYATNAPNVSWHYTVGNEGAYNHLPLDEIGWHAGDGTGVPLAFTDTLIKAPEGDLRPAVVTINQTSGKFEFNGIESNIVAPLTNTGLIVRNDQLPTLGIANYVDQTTGNYMVGNTWWSKDYQTLGNYGGNLNSIGIESAINDGTNIYLTWHNMAKLIATDILPATGLLTTDVKNHNFFSGKNCPMTMRNAGMWWEFMKMVEAEDTVYRNYSKFTFTFSSDSPYLNSNGTIKSLPEASCEVSYKITMSDGKDYNKTLEYTVVLPARSVISFNKLYN